MPPECFEEVMDQRFDTRYKQKPAEAQPGVKKKKKYGTQECENKNAACQTTKRKAFRGPARSSPLLCGCASLSWPTKRSWRKKGEECVKSLGDHRRVCGAGSSPFLHDLRSDFKGAKDPAKYSLMRRPNLVQMCKRI